jgi:hypothetical protein
VSNHTTARFREMRDRLPEQVRRSAYAAFDIFKTNPDHPGLNFRKVGRFWGISFANGYRALAVKDGEDLIWFFIGSHADYDKIKKA